MTPLSIPASLRGREVLLVEDNPISQIVATELLRDEAGMQVTIAEDGLQALQVLAARRFDIVLMDIQMGGLDGLETTRRIRHDLGLNHLPVIAMTAHAAHGGKAVCMHAGMNDHVMKPFEPQALLDVLARWLEAAPDAVSDRAQQVVDFHVGMRRCMGKADLYRRIASRFLDAKGREVGQIREALMCGEHARAANLAHQLISSAGTLGAEGLAQAARTLQLTLLEGRVDMLPAQLEALEAQFRDVLRALQAHVKRPDWTSQTPGTPPDMHEPSI